MTVLDANNALFEWFMNNDSFVMERDLKKVIPIVEEQEEVENALKMALQQLEEANLIKISEDKKYHILTKNFGSYQQSPEINSFVAGYISKQINDFCGLIGDHTDQCDAGNLCEKDIKNLCHIIDYYKEVVAKENKGLQ